MWIQCLCLSVRSGLSAADAEVKYLENAKLLAFYGVDRHRAVVRICHHLFALITSNHTRWSLKDAVPIFC